MDFTQEISPLPFWFQTFFVKFREITFTSNWELRSLSWKGDEHFLCNQAWCCKVFKKWAPASFQDPKYQQTFFADKLHEAGRKHTAFFVFNQYSLTCWDDLFPCTLYYSISLCNRGCSLLNTAHMRAWNHQNSILLCVNLSRWGCKSAASDKQRARITSVWESEVRISYDIDLQHYCLLGRVGSHRGQHSLSA